MLKSCSDIGLDSDLEANCAAEFTAELERVILLIGKWFTKADLLLTQNIGIGFRLIHWRWTLPSSLQVTRVND